MHLIATAPERRLQGLATQLLEQLFQAACAQNSNRILLEVRADNHAAQRLYHKHGFTAIATRKRYYSNGDDAIIMEKQC